MSAPQLVEVAPLNEHPVDCRDCDFIIDGDQRGMLKPTDIARRWGVTKTVIYRLIREGRIPIMNLSPGSRGGKGQRYLVRACVVRELEKRHDAPVPAQQ